MKLTQSQFVQTIQAVKGNTFATLSTDTVPDMNKTGNPYFGRLRKLSKVNVSIGAIYENGVNRQAGREGNEDAGEFVAAPLAYGEWLVPHKLILHKGEIQVRATMTQNVKPEVSYLYDGEPIETALVEPYLKKKAVSRRQEDFGNEKQVIPRNYKLSSIKEITINGTHYTIG